MELKLKLKRHQKSKEQQIQAIKETQNQETIKPNKRTTMNCWQYGWTWLDKTCIDSEN